MSDNIHELARNKSQADLEYNKGMRAHVRQFKPLDTDTFWPLVEKLAHNVDQCQKWNYGSNAVKSGVHNLFCYEVSGDMEKWEMMARFLARYMKVKAALSQKLWELPGLEKGDDGYGDFIDSLPLAGKDVVFGLHNDDIANYKQLQKALADHPLKDFVLEGENYVEMKFEEVLYEQFLAAVMRMDYDENEERYEEDVRPHAVMVTEPFKKFSFDGNLKLETTIYGPFNSEEESLAWLKQEGHTGIPLRLFPGVVLR